MNEPSDGPGSWRIPDGFLASGVKAGIKASGSDDFAMIASTRPCAAAGVYTTNRIAAAPVRWDRRLTPSRSIRAIAVNSGNANAATGDQGLANAKRTAELAAARLGCEAEQVCVASTGVIGHQLPMDRIEAGLVLAHAALSATAEGFEQASRAIMTTDTRPKMVSQTFATASGAEVRILGMAKGAAMIGPRMATMLGFVCTDAAVDPEDLQGVLSRAVDETFNCISVEGHASTNDTVLLLANGEGPALSGGDLEEFERRTREVCAELARMIVDDGEGATHTIAIDVEGCESREQARALARAVADSPLVKTAIHGADPNWGRIVSAAGYAGVPFDQRELTLWVNGILLYDAGSPLPFDAQAASDSIRERRDVHVRLQFRLGTASIRFWTCDLTAEYVRLNADYTT